MKQARTAAGGNGNRHSAKIFQELRIRQLTLNVFYLHIN